MAVPSYPFPNRNPTYPTTEDVIYSAACPPSSPQYLAAHERAQGVEARLYRLRYLSIEEELEQAYHYVTPSEENADTYSFKFAELIRAAANAYEISCRVLYDRFYNEIDERNIFNYLALDYFLNFAGKKVVHLLAVGIFTAFPEMSQPFVKLVPWNRHSSVQPSHIPDWWTAYNKVKHTDAGLKT